MAFVPAPATVGKQCRQAANAVGYPVPCPTMLPRGLRPTSGGHGCRFGIVAAWGPPRCKGATTEWHGWIVGSSQVYAAGSVVQQLDLQGAPRAVHNPIAAIYGPGDTGQFGRKLRVHPRGTVRMSGRVMRWYYVPNDAYDDMVNHLVLVWTASGHTYAYGFQVTSTVAEARALDRELVRHLVTVEPSTARSTVRSRAARQPNAALAPTKSASSYPPAYRPLTSILGVLRRPQTDADRDPALLKTLRRQAHYRALSVSDGKPVIALVRLATVAPWGAKLFLVPYRPLSRRSIAALPAKPRVVARATRMSLVIYSAGTTSGNQTAAQIHGGRDLATPETRRSDRYVMVLPEVLPGWRYGARLVRSARTPAR